MDNLFLKIHEIIDTAKEKGFISVENLEPNCIENDFLNYIISLIQNGTIPEYYYFCIDCYVHKQINKQKFSDMDYEKIFVIKHLASAFIEQDADLVENFSNYLCSGYVRDVITKQIDKEEMLRRIQAKDIGKK